MANTQSRCQSRWETFSISGKLRCNSGRAAQRRRFAKSFTFSSRRVSTVLPWKRNSFHAFVPTGKIQWSIREVSIFVPGGSSSHRDSSRCRLPSNAFERADELDQKSSLRQTAGAFLSAGVDGITLALELIGAEIRRMY